VGGGGEEFGGGGGQWGVGAGSAEVGRGEGGWLGRWGGGDAWGWREGGRVGLAMAEEG
jgi:hypothetical protein